MRTLILLSFSRDIVRRKEADAHNGSPKMIWGAHSILTCQILSGTFHVLGIVPNNFMKSSPPFVRQGLGGKRVPGARIAEGPFPALLEVPGHDSTVEPMLAFTQYSTE